MVQCNMSRSSRIFPLSDYLYQIASWLKSLPWLCIFIVFLISSAVKLNNVLSRSVGRFKPWFRHTLASGYTNMSPVAANKTAVASVSFWRAEKENTQNRIVRIVRISEMSETSIKVSLWGQPMRNDCCYKQLAFELQQWYTRHELRRETATKQK